MATAKKLTDVSATHRLTVWREDLERIHELLHEARDTYNAPLAPEKHIPPPLIEDRSYIYSDLDDAAGKQGKTTNNLKITLNGRTEKEYIRVSFEGTRGRVESKGEPFEPAAKKIAEILASGSKRFFLFPFAFICVCFAATVIVGGWHARWFLHDVGIAPVAPLHHEETWTFGFTLGMVSVTGLQVILLGLYGRSYHGINFERFGSFREKVRANAGKAVVWVFGLILAGFIGAWIKGMFGGD